MGWIRERPTGYLAGYRDLDKVEHNRIFKRKGDAKKWLAAQESAVGAGTHVDPKTARTTVADWCETWMAGWVAGKRPSTIAVARSQVKEIVAEFGPMRISLVRPSHVRSWLAKLEARGFAPNSLTVFYGRLRQIMSAAVHDKLLTESPCSRQTSPPRAKQRPNVPTTEQVWALYEAMHPDVCAAVLLAAFAGLRAGEVCGLRIADVDFMNCVITPAVQYPAKALKTETCCNPIPIPRALANMLASHVHPERGAHVLVSEVMRDELGRFTGRGGDTIAWDRQVSPIMLGHRYRAARAAAGLPEDLRFHDLRHYFASMLIASGTDVKVVQARMRHAKATTTLDTYGHLWPGSDEVTRSAVEAVLGDRADFLRTKGGDQLA